MQSEHPAQLPGFDAPPKAERTGYNREWQVGQTRTGGGWWLADGDFLNTKPGEGWWVVHAFHTEVGARYWQQKLNRLAAEIPDQKAYNKAVAKVLDKADCND